MRDQRVEGKSGRRSSESMGSGGMITILRGPWRAGPEFAPMAGRGGAVAVFPESAMNRRADCIRTDERA